MKYEEIFAGVELRAAGEGKAETYGGLAAVYGLLSLDLGGFVERFAAGAFKQVLADKPDVLSLFNHSPDKVLGRTTAETLTLEETDDGLAVSGSFPPTTWAKDLAINMRRNEIKDMSVAFQIAPNGEEWRQLDNGLVERTVINVSVVRDVSIVTLPAYPDTTVALRAKADDATHQNFDSFMKTLRTPEYNHYKEALRRQRASLQSEWL